MKKLTTLFMLALLSVSSAWADFDCMLSIHYTTQKELS